ncbi:aldehyde dehydrogenase family protein [Paenibacillus sp. JDR-2]|uniref:aldehyde dehydrogenase family protein n=1 Tax=Paenibacillus sp. (strain JDR-2) TaxID=324057 RepID=UPI0002D765C9|nr:aldehyde dehydrogenase family protein [Paenibacillus sp. JDR-2]
MVAIGSITCRICTFGYSPRKAANNSGSTLVSEAPSVMLPRLVLEGERIGGVVTPFVFADVDPKSRLAQTEIFGPIASIIPFESDDEVLALVNDTEYGLSGAVFTTDLDKGVAFARAFESGMTHVNDTTINMDMKAPFGGEKASGIGHYHGEIGFEEFTTAKWVSVQKDRRLFPF